MGITWDNCGEDAKVVEHFVKNLLLDYLKEDWVADENTSEIGHGDRKMKVKFTKRS